MLQKNDQITLSITGMLSDGSGVGKTEDGFAVFVRGSAIGDQVLAHIIKVSKRYAVGKLIDVLAPSPDRIDNDCPSFPRCGGCAYRHISYEAECRIKKQTVQDALTRIGGIDIEVESILHGDTEGYRNKAQYPIGEKVIGFYAEHSHRIVEARSCRLQPPEFEQIVDIVDAWRSQYPTSCFDGKRGVLRHLYIRKGYHSQQLMVCLVINADRLAHSDQLVERLKEAFGEQLKSVMLNHNTSHSNVVLSDRYTVLHGDDHITDTLCGVQVKLSAASFYQVNTAMAEQLYRKAQEFAGTGGTLIDLYCGAGTIGLSMAEQFDRIIGVEVVEPAVRDARQNAAANGIENAEFYCGDALKVAKQLDGQCDVLIVDPPRKGLSEELPALIAEKFAPEKIVYVSCDPATLARDCKAFQQNGYRVVRACAADLFARTRHVESVVLMVKQQATESAI